MHRQLFIHDTAKRPLVTKSTVIFLTNSLGVVVFYLPHTHRVVKQNQISFCSFLFRSFVPQSFYSSIFLLGVKKKVGARQWT